MIYHSGMSVPMDTMRSTYIRRPEVSTPGAYHITYGSRETWPAGFRGSLRQWLRANPGALQAMQDALQVSSSTFRDWRSGVKRPRAGALAVVEKIQREWGGER